MRGKSDTCETNKTPRNVYSMKIIKHSLLPITLAIPAVLSLSAASWHPGGNYSVVQGWFAYADSSGYTGVWGASPNGQNALFYFGCTYWQHGLYEDPGEFTTLQPSMNISRTWSNADGYTTGELWLIQGSNIADAWVQWY